MREPSNEQRVASNEASRPDHRGDPYPGYLGETDLVVIAAWRERYEQRMTGYALPLPATAVQGVLL